jgi:formylglycine-generating enzyme required for sulfatase activity
MGHTVAELARRASWKFGIHARDGRHSDAAVVVRSGQSRFALTPSLFSGSFPGLRGGSWNNNSNNLASSNRNNDNPTNENNNIGFRVASPWQRV